MGSDAAIALNQLPRLNELLELVLEVPVENRLAWLAALTPVDQALLPMLRKMLDTARIERDTFMDRPLDLHAAGFGFVELRADTAGDLVGPYQLVREVGSGGMGTVWLADRVDGSLCRRVALKLPRVGWVPGLAQRMERERDILAALEHPNIARLYDAGITAAARQWLAMEYVPGLPVDAYCVAHGLSIEQRLRLFLQVADAVTYAHSRLIVHRDLKPSNILVTDRGDVRLLDFGIAKVLAANSVGDDLTQIVGPAVTPDYASPEQIFGQPLTVATDVYSLGVVLYELVTGARPYRLGDAHGGALKRAVLCAATPLASSRIASNRAFAKQLRGDIDNILVKALRKRPEQRYASVESMAADITRHLQREPVLAQPQGYGYRLKKALWRHRGPVTATAAVMLSLVIGLGLAAWQAGEAQSQSRLAQASLKRAELAMDFATIVLSESVFHDEPRVSDGDFSSWQLCYEQNKLAEQLLTRTLSTLPAHLDRLPLESKRCQRALTCARLGKIVEDIAQLDRVIAKFHAQAETLPYCLLKRPHFASRADYLNVSMHNTPPSVDH